MTESIENRTFYVKLELDKLNPAYSYSEKGTLHRMLQDLRGTVNNLDRAIQSGNPLIIMDGCDFHRSLIDSINCLKEWTRRRTDSKHWPRVIDAINNLITELRAHYNLDAFSN